MWILFTLNQFWLNRSSSSSSSSSLSNSSGSSCCCCQPIQRWWHFRHWIMNQWFIVFCSITAGLDIGLTVLCVCVCVCVCMCACVRACVRARQFVEVLWLHKSRNAVELPAVLRYCKCTCDCRQPTSFTGITHAFMDLAKFKPQVNTHASIHFLDEPRLAGYPCVHISLGNWCLFLGLMEKSAYESRTTTATPV